MSTLGGFGATKNKQGLEEAAVKCGEHNRGQGPVRHFGEKVNLPLKTPSPGEVFIFYRHIAHVTQKNYKVVCFKR